ncbi:ImmA/IrrE family metallo-endopeptidase [Devosia sp. Leaf64]|uniref:ImmA/IrrE family metallo-endopeptidase n=1 Tax=Devosia sp. Leaf64 TaxID=1736229 RepID=UPI00138F2267|nr:ImmA/IrrE family metallo-endopeptidase [Devosia sp. Leaf64]
MAMLDEGIIAEVPARPRYKLAQARADALTVRYSTPPIPVLEIAEQTGVNVVFSDFGKHSDTVAGFCDFEARRLYVNAKDIRTRQLFTMAHELGHWVMHREVFLRDPSRYPVLPRFQSVEASNIFEREANCFAANLLVPKRLLDPVRNSPVSTLAEVFGVSRAMMENRLKNG